MGGNCGKDLRDLEKAFDCINHHILLSKLSYCRITGKSHAWIKSYLGNRYKRLVINFNHNTVFILFHSVLIYGRNFLQKTKIIKL